VTMSGIPRQFPPDPTNDYVEWGAGLRALGNTSCRGALNQVRVIVGARRGKGVGFSVTPA
jgi:hypothetical protein